MPPFKRRLNRRYRQPLRPFLHRRGMTAAVLLVSLLVLLLFILLHLYVKVTIIYLLHLKESVHGRCRVRCARIVVFLKLRHLRRSHAELRVGKRHVGMLTESEALALIE